MEAADLIERARRAADLAYAPYSRFRVGAALLCKDGTVVTGCNVENRSYGLTMCAERNAIAKALSLGKREYAALAIYSPDSEGPIPPCGACRQVVSEFVEPSFPVHYQGRSDKLETVSMSRLLPFDSLQDLKDRLSQT